MAFILPNGTVFDPERADRQMILQQMSQRRESSARERASKRNADLQAQMLGAEMEMGRRGADQEAALAREEMSLRERLASKAEEAAGRRLTDEREYAENRLAAQNLALVDEEERIAQGLAGRMNALFAQHNALRPDPKDKENYQKWERDGLSLRARVPANMEGALSEDGGKWSINTDYFKLKRAPWIKPAKATAAIASALNGKGEQAPIPAVNPTDESIWRSMVRISPGAAANPPAVQARPAVPAGPQVPPVAAAIQAITNGLPRNVQPSSGIYMGGFGLPPGRPIAQPQTPEGPSIWDAIAQALSQVGRGGMGGSPATGYPLIDLPPQDQILYNRFRLLGAQP